MYDSFLQMFQGIEEEEYKQFISILHRILQNIRKHEF
jgi:MarR family transcriptional regulator for hemolysin